MTSTRVYATGEQVLVNGKPATVTRSNASIEGWTDTPDTVVNVIFDKPGRGPKQIDAPLTWVTPA